MPNHPLFHPVSDAARATDLRDQIQIALALSDSAVLRSLLVNCIPSITQWQQVGAVSTELSVPTGEQQAADGVLHFEAVKCVPACEPRPAEHPPAGGWTRESKQLARMIQYESEMQTLGQFLPLAPMVSLLAEAGFCSRQIEEILRLPRDGWHKSWWYAIDENGEFTRPFLRQIRTLHHPNGTVTVQYRDFFEQEKPPCFSRLAAQVLIFIKSETQEFGEILKRINYQRKALGIDRAILICNTISELEARAFITQGISIYPAAELVLPVQANCVHCQRRDCAMNGTENSPVAVCYGFLPAQEYV